MRLSEYQLRLTGSAMIVFHRVAHDIPIRIACHKVDLSAKFHLNGTYSFYVANTGIDLSEKLTNQVLVQVKPVTAIHCMIHCLI